jgi:sugar phosphate isomerase/epimerase
MEGWHPDGYPGNLAYSPELWEWMFAQGLYLNYDPSHLVWMGIDPVEALRPYVDHVAHAQAKDIQVFPERRTHYGWPGRAVVREDPWDVGWWRYRVPGSARSTGGPSSTPSTRADIREFCPSSTKTPSGAAPRTA